MFKNLFFIILINTSIVAQTTINPAQITTIAAKQRMYTERLAKAKFAKNYFIDVENSNRQINIGIILFDENLKMLTNYVANDEYKQKIDKIISLWKDYQEQIKSEDASSINKIYKSNTELLDNCNDVIKILNAYFKSKGSNEKSDFELQVADYSATSGRLRYLSQRAALYYIYAFKNIGKPTVELKNTIDLFDTTVSSLLTCQFNTGEIDENLSKIFTEWNSIKSQAVAKDGTISITEKSIAPEVMIANCDKILVLAEKLTSQYIGLLK